jgi:hypothetical protein
MPRCFRIWPVLLTLACASPADDPIRLGDDLWMISSRGGRGASAESERRDEALGRGRSFCSERGGTFVLDSLISSPSSPHRLTPSASVTFRCIASAPDAADAPAHEGVR